MVKEKLMERYDWQQRTALLLGEEKMERIRNAHVLVEFSFSFLIVVFYPAFAWLYTNYHYTYEMLRRFIVEQEIGRASCRERV